MMILCYLHFLIEKHRFHVPNILQTTINGYSSMNRLNKLLSTGIECGAFLIRAYQLSSYSLISRSFDPKSTQRWEIGKKRAQTSTCQREKKSQEHIPTKERNKSQEHIPQKKSRKYNEKQSTVFIAAHQRGPMVRLLSSYLTRENAMQPRAYV